VKIGGALVEQFGYNSSGRTYCIADTHEAWMLSVVKGKHWVAKRIPDDEVAIIPNYYTITSVNLSDTMNYYGSADLVAYAQKKKWYKPEAMGEFNFREVYSDQQNLENMGNVVRHWSAINQFAAKNYMVEDEFPFSFIPKQKVTLNLLFQVLRNHNEGSEYDESAGYTKGNPHQQGRAICSSTTQYGFVAQLRSDLPVDIGAVLWLAPFRPCVHPFTQWYVGMTKIPKGFSEGNHIKALETHFNAIENVYEYAPDNNFLKFVKHAKNVDEDYGNLINPILSKIQMLETELQQNQESFEKQLLKLNSPDKRQIQTAVNEYSKKQVERSLELNN
jgi:dipeptidase